MSSDLLANLGLYPGNSALVLLACLFLLWLISLKIKDASIIDIFWGMGFVIVALVCFYMVPGKTGYQKLLMALPVIWGLRLSLYLARRNLGHGQDPRYTAMQKRAEKQGLSEARWRQRAFFSIFLGQGLLILLVSAPVWIGMAQSYYAGHNSVAIITTIGPLALLGTCVWLIGFLFEAIGDWQLKRFLKKNKDYDGPYEDKPVLSSGLWKYTRHPNYFGDALMWWGIFLVACQAPMGWMSVFGPILMTYLLVKVSGKALLERKLKKRPAYQDYIERTSGFLPRRQKKKPG